MTYSFRDKHGYTFEIKRTWYGHRLRIYDFWMDRVGADIIYLDVKPDRAIEQAKKWAA